MDSLVVKKINRRRLLTWGGLSLFFYPVFKFIGFTIPRKPVHIVVANDIPGTGFLQEKKFILFEKNGKAWALSRKCTHLGCKVSYFEEGGFLECPCHQSKFNAETGAVIQGPATLPLTSYHVEKGSGNSGYVVTI